MNITEKIKNHILEVPDFPHAGINFKDITPIFRKQDLCDEIVKTFADQIIHSKPDAIVGIESRGFLFGFLLANYLNIPFILIRKVGKLPGKTVKLAYELEYGTATIEIHDGALEKDWNVVIHDDLLATGGTAEAAARLIKSTGANVSAYTFLVELDFLEGEKKIKSHCDNIISLVHY